VHHVGIFSMDSILIKLDKKMKVTSYVMM